MSKTKQPDSFDKMIAEFGLPHTWDKWTWFLNIWRLMADQILIRMIIDTALRCPDELTQLYAQGVIGKAINFAELDLTWPGRNAFHYESLRYESTKENA